MSLEVKPGQVLLLCTWVSFTRKEKNNEFMDKSVIFYIE
jgi:hypothetical protein